MKFKLENTPQVSVTAVVMPGTQAVTLGPCLARPGQAGGGGHGPAWWGRGTHSAGSSRGIRQRGGGGHTGPARPPLSFGHPGRPRLGPGWCDAHGARGRCRVQRGVHQAWAETRQQLVVPTTLFTRAAASGSSLSLGLVFGCWILC